MVEDQCCSRWGGGRGVFGVEDAAVGNGHVGHCYDSVRNTAGDGSIASFILYFAHSRRGGVINKVP